MSHNQSRSESRESYQNRKPGRSGSFNQYRGSKGGGGGGGGGSGSAPAPSPSSSYNRSFNKKYNNAQGGYRAASDPSGSSARGVQNGAHQEQPLSEVLDAAPITTAGVPPLGTPVNVSNAPTQKINRAVPRPPPSNSSAGPDPNAPGSSKAPGDGSKSFPLQFGSLNPSFMNGMQVPARTSSAPPNLDEQKRSQARLNSLKPGPALPNPSTSVQPPAKKDAGKVDQFKKDSGKVDQYSNFEGPVHSRSKRDMPSSGPPPLTQTLKPSPHPLTGMHMQMPFHPAQPQVPVPYGGHGQIQSQTMSGSSLPIQMSMPLLGNPSLQQPMFVTGLPPHPMSSQGIMHQGQGLSFAPGINPQMPPQLGNMGMNIPPQFPQQQAGKFSSLRKTVKITHPDTHEELRLDGSPGPRSHPSMPPQSQPLSSFPPTPINYYPNSYNNSSVYFQPPSSLPPKNSQSPQAARFYNQVTIKPAPSTPGEKDQVTVKPALGIPGERDQLPLVSSPECHIKVADELTDHLAAQVDEGASNSVLEACPDMKSLKIPKFVDSGSAWSPSAGHEKHFFAGSCAACSKQRRVGHGLPKVELCSCVAISNKDCDKLSSPKDEIGVEAIIISGSAEKFNSGQSKGAPSDPHMDRNDNVCAVCKQGGKGLLCSGKDCKRCSHPPSLGTPVHDVPSGVWHCLWCLKKKIESGVHSVTQGVESIWDAREVDVSGTHRQKQYLVKYTGLAHVHNHWVSEAQLLHEAPSLVANFNDKNQVIRWNSEWTVPHRLLKKRLLSFSELQGGCHNFDAGDNSECQYEWLVKWRGLDYENATWELENANFLCSPHGQSLVKEYEIRQEKAKQVINKNNKQSLVELSKNWAGSSLVTDIDILNSINKLQDCWWKSQNAAFYDDQEQIVKIILFILSLSTVCWPVLIITTSNAISKWEAEFMKWAPSLDCVVYHGSRESRKSIETLEFYSQGGCIMLQVLLTSLETVVEDIHVLNSLSWEVVVIDQCQHSNVSTHIEKIKTLAGLKVLLFNGPIKHTAFEYSNLLSLVDSDGDLDKVDLLKSHSNDTLGQLKERFPWFTSCSSKWTSKFLEYWLPVQISELQLELYCDTLLSNINALCSYSKSDPVGALNDIFLNVRKCCDHPFTIWDPSLNPFNKGLSQPEILDIGIKASGKLQILDKMLSEMKCRQLRTIVLFQSFVGTMPSIGDILDDFLRQRFGENSYERIDAFLIRSKKESALNRFNKLENGRFVFLLENRACKATLKLSSVDNVIIYGSDTNPWNDLRLLEKISFDSDSKPIKVFRLYSSFTVEEQALVIAKQEPDHLHSPNRNLNNTLMWGASDLLSRLDGHYAGDSQASAMHTSTGQSLFSDVIREFSTIISESSENAGMQTSVISKVLHSSSHCTTNLSLFGEQKNKCTGGEAPSVFWKSLLGGRNPQWRHISCPSPSPRSRKRVQFFDGSSPEINVAKKSRKMNSGFDAISVQPEHEGGQPSASKEGPSTIRAANESLPTSTTCENEVDLVEPAERKIISDEQLSLHIYLKAEMAKIFEVLKLSEDVKKMAGSFLEYVMENHRISREPVGIFHAFQISLCWTAASFLKQKVDKEEMLALTKEYLNFKCTKDEAATVYLRLRALKKIFSQHMKRNKSMSNSLELSEASKSGDTCKAPIQPPLEEHTVDEVLSVEHAKEVSMECDHPPKVHDDAPDVAAGYEHTAEANTIADGSAEENVTPINRTDLTSTTANEKEVTSNSGDGNQTLQEVTSSDDGGLLPQNQCNGTQLSESQSISQIESGLSEPINAGHRMSDCESVLAENSGNQPASDASGRSPPGEVADMICNQEDSSLQTSRPSPQLVETGTVIQPSPDADSQDPLYNEFDRMRREMENAAKSHEDLKSQLKSNCEKEIEEIIAEIRNKYNARLQEADTRYSLRKNELGGNLKKVLLNKLLADTFRSKCNDIKPSKLPAVPTSYIQHLRQPSTQPTSRSASLTGSSPAGRQTSAPACMRPPTASPSAGEQTSAQTSTRPPSVALSSSGQVAGRQTSAPACTRPWITSPSAGEQTSAQTCTRLPSDSLSSSSGQQVAGQQTSAPSKSSPVVGESPRRLPSISLVPAGMQTPSPVRMRSPSIGLSSGGQTVVGQHTPAPSRPPSMVGKSPRIPSRPPLISSITPSSGNPRLGCEIRAPAPHLQSFRPSMSASTAGPSPILSARPNLSSYSSSLNHVPIRPGVMSSQNPQHKEQPLSLQQPPASISDSLSALELHTNLDNQPNPNRPRQSGWPSLSTPANMSSSSSPSLNHFKTEPLVLDSSQLLQKMDHPLPHPQNQPSEPDNRPLSAVNILRLSATELLKNLDNHCRNFDNQASATQPKQSGGPGNCIAANSSSSSPSLNHAPSQQPSALDSSKLSQDQDQPQPLGANDFNPQNQPAVNILPFSALELLRNVDNQATASANQPND